MTDFGANDWLIEQLRERYEKDPASVDPKWVEYFGGTAQAQPPTAAAPVPPLTPADSPAPQAGSGSPATNTDSNPPASAAPAPAQPSAGAQTMPAAEPTPPTAPAPAGSARVDATAAASAPAASAPAPAAPPHSPASPALEANVATHSTAPQVPGSGLGVSPNRPAASDQAAAKEAREPKRTQLRGAPMRTAQNMEASLAVPTATSVRAVPMKLVIDQRQAINEFLATTTGGKVSFTHIIGYAMVQAMKAVPVMNSAYEVVDGKPFLVEPADINLGLAIDTTKADGSRQLLVPSIKGAQDMDFYQFWQGYEAIVKKARSNSLTVADFQGTTASLTNPGGIGTNHSVPRLMGGQSVILGVGSIDYPPEFHGVSQAKLNDLAVSKITTFTSTYDHRIIQGAQSGEFLKYLHELLIGQHGFYDDIYTSLRIPYTPLRWSRDVSYADASTKPREARMFSLIGAYRRFGHYQADIDPLEFRVRTHPELAAEFHGLTIWDLDREFPTGGLGGHQGTLSMRKILNILTQSYSRTIGLEYMHIADAEQRAWIQERFERSYQSLPREEHLRILDKLNEAELFETFLQTKFVGQKRFSLEGAESAIVFLDEVCEQAADTGLEEVVIGMPHRGRLNVLAAITGKSYGQIFREFEGNYNPELDQGSGDVKYHLGADGCFTSGRGNTIRTSVAANPSHLETVSPVVEGIARAKLDQLPSHRRDEWAVLPVLLHGDAAFAGQGVVYETMQMSQLHGYRTGGTIHLVVNNQVGFTTAPSASRSSVYCTDLAKAWQCPIFHVNGDDPEAVARVAQVAFAFREQFHKDVVIDLVCYRRRGHNEGDDPSFTQPKMYDLINQKRTSRELYTEALVGRGDISPEDAEEVASRFRARLEEVFAEVKQADAPAEPEAKTPYYPKKLGVAEGTSISAEVMEKVAAAQLSFPEGFTVHPKVLPQLERRAKSLREGDIDWASAELLALGSLLLEGRPVRMAGQDTRRGTFSQRFASVVDRVTNEYYTPLKHMADDQGRLHVYDSLLSEYAALGFEYGYSVAAPDALVVWEAQFGDFANGAQSVIDEYISAGNSKWTQKSGVVLLLPHGYEGQGPDHSSARIERWLNLCSEGALAVCQPSTPASYFHLLRTHAYVNWHRPVVIMTPKSMLRNKQAVSQVSDFTHGSWQPAMGDPTISDPAAVERILLCSGKIRWTLVNARAAAGLDGKVAILPLERLYPLPTKELAAELAKYPQVKDVRWVQDEPENQGAWWFLQLYLPAAIAEAIPGYELKMTGVTRPAASAPSVGSLKLHQAQEKDLMDRALN
ncbi:MAG: multifunctional oxoglutarate decarboxylase/oxoglutarate dehydrogenase thiamine pyrophosphate-binding subunit/dihydrolipoyllysine-residue succinyltransferase subunit [Propionibacteriaceae bacterium]|jgi:2-oxoglutarate dehydrogenase E1 component|nr:multifunctional oxoglutarate decarboxylase/oxoglutarate dehydrogenase thiamine pyrophosphate-binding subunit/dihydrolipoyllysine-residue succinyltransferase subunit [Propionibacteriaceae bacterium]